MYSCMVTLDLPHSALAVPSIFVFSSFVLSYIVP